MAKAIDELVLQRKKELPQALATQESVALLAQQFSAQRDAKNKAWSNLKDAVGKMTQPFQPLSVMLAQSAAPQVAAPSQMNMAASDDPNALSDFDYEMALNQAINGIVDTVLSENLITGRSMI